METRTFLASSFRYISRDKEQEETLQQSQPRFDAWLWLVEKTEKVGHTAFFWLLIGGEGWMTSYRKWKRLKMGWPVMSENQASCQEKSESVQSESVCMNPNGQRRPTDKAQSPNSYVQGGSVVPGPEWSAASPALWQKRVQSPNNDLQGVSVCLGPSGQRRPHWQKRPKSKVQKTGTGRCDVTMSEAWADWIQVACQTCL